MAQRDVSASMMVVQTMSSGEEFVGGMELLNANVKKQMTVQWGVCRDMVKSQNEPRGVCHVYWSMQKSWCTEATY